MRTELFLSTSLALATAACGDVSAPDPMPELGVTTAMTSARVIRLRTIDIPIEITRNADVVGPVTVEVDGLPANVTAWPLMIAEGETSPRSTCARWPAKSPR